MGFRINRDGKISLINSKVILNKEGRDRERLMLVDALSGIGAQVFISLHKKPLYRNSAARKNLCRLHSDRYCSVLKISDFMFIHIKLLLCFSYDFYL